MRYLLDTNAVIGVLRGRSRSLLARYITVPRVRICTCSPVRAELFYGSQRSANAQAAMAFRQGAAKAADRSSSAVTTACMQ